MTEINIPPMGPAPEALNEFGGPIIVGGGLDNPTEAAEALSGSGSTGAPQGDGFVAEGTPGAEPAPENPKLDEAIKEKNSMEKKIGRTYRQQKLFNAAKEEAEEVMKAKKEAYEAAKQARIEAKKTLWNLRITKYTDNLDVDLDELGEEIKRAKERYTNANEAYKNAASEYNTSAKKFNRLLKICQKCNIKEYNLKKACNKLHSRITKLGGPTYIDYKNPMEGNKALKSQKVTTSAAKFIKGKGGKALIAGVVLAGAAYLGTKLFGSDSTTTEEVEAQVPVTKEETPAPVETTAEQEVPATPTEESEETEAPAASAEESAEAQAPAASAEESEEAQAPAASAEGSEETEAPATPTEGSEEAETPAASAEESEEAQAPAASAEESEEAEEVDEEAIEEEIANEENEPIYEVKPGDNLWNIAKKELKNKNGEAPTNAQILARVKEVMEKNGLEFESDGYRVLIYAGDKLKM